MQKFILFLLTSIITLFSTIGVFAGDAIKDSETNVRDVNIGTTGKTNTLLENFIQPIRSFFIAPDAQGGE